MSEDSATGYPSGAGAVTGGDDYNAMLFVVQQIMARTRTMTLVKVAAVNNNDEVAPVGLLDVTPLVNLIDALGQVTENETIYNVPYTRIQGGSNAIIIDPKVGDIGWMAVADRDISAVKEAKDTASPGSRRRFNLADGVYIGGILNGKPTRYVRFAGTGLEIVAPDKITLTAPTVEINASIALNVNGNANITGNLIVTGMAAISGAISAVSIALTGAISALSAAITNLLTSGSATIAGNITSTSGAILASAGTVTGTDCIATQNNGVAAPPYHLRSHGHSYVPGTAGSATTTAPLS